ncbi:MFS transporter [Dongia deserti]|uniref:MFS transporter n=1 Tax=Dongia deserti TaxID=2268030 RepID=UPI000E65387F|nr:MFS transporter [Dongia deserti]
MSSRLVASKSALMVPGAGAFAAVYALDSAARALTATVIPLHAYTLYKAIAAEDADSYVGTTYSVVAMITFIGTFLTPFIIHRLGRNATFIAGILACMIGMVGLATSTIPGLGLGMLGRALSGVLGSVCLILFIVDFIPRQNLVRSETLRLFTSCLAWGFGPVVGVALHQRYGIVAPAAVSITVHLGLILYFRRLRPGEPRIEAIPPPANPLTMIRRFAAQKRLRLSWLIVFGRSAWWSMFFTYPALYLQDQGIDERWAGWLVGVGNLLLALSPLVRMVAQRLGIRLPIVGAFWCGGALTIGVILLYDQPLGFCLVLLLAATFVVALDSLGNIPFMRFARPRELPQLATVFRTYVDTAEFIPSAIYAMLLTIFDFRAVFVFAGVLAVTVGIAATWLPKRL